MTAPTQSIDLYRLSLMLAYGKAKESGFEYFAAALATEIAKLEVLP